MLPVRDFPFPTVEHGLEGLDAGNDPVAFRLGKLFQSLKVRREDGNCAGCHSRRHPGWTARPHPIPGPIPSFWAFVGLKAQANPDTGQHS